MIADNLAHANILVLDLETIYSADDCFVCHGSQDDHAPTAPGNQSPHAWTPIGWDRKADLGISIGCYWDYDDMALHWFDHTTVEATVSMCVRRRPLLVSFNGITFDFPLMRALLHARSSIALEQLCASFKAQCSESYDVLQVIWNTYPAWRRGKGVCSLDALCAANALPRKTMQGSTAPRRWREGRYADVIAYNVADVLATRALFERMVTADGLFIANADGRPMWRGLPAPSYLHAYLAAKQLNATIRGKEPTDALCSE